MIFKELIHHFNITDEFPDYLLEESFNEIFKDGDLSKESGEYKIVVETRQNVTHQMFIRPNDNFPLIILSKLPNGSLNGIKFGLDSDDVTYINEL